MDAMRALSIVNLLVTLMLLLLRVTTNVLELRASVYLSAALTSDAAYGSASAVR